MIADILRKVPERTRYRPVVAFFPVLSNTIVVQRDPRGRPMLHGRWADWDCNWSHSGDGLLVALGHRTRLGIDLEWRRPRPRAPG